jgi:hypothetical protein
VARSPAETAGSARARSAIRDHESHLLDDVAAVVSLTAAAFMVLSFVAYQRALPNLNVAGRVGHGLADVAVQAFGYAAYLAPLYLVLVAVALFRHAAHGLSITRGIAALVFLLCGAVLLGVAAPPPALRPVTLAGGWLGGFLAALLGQGFGTLGTAVIVGAMAVLSFVVATRLSLSGLARGAARGVAGRFARAPRSVAAPAREAIARAPRANLKRPAPASDAAPLIGLADVERRAACSLHPATKICRSTRRRCAGAHRFSRPSWPTSASPARWSRCDRAR